MKTKIIIAVVGVMVVVGVVAGVLIYKNSQSQATNGQPNGNGNIQGQAQNRFGGRGLSGTIDSFSNGTMVMNLDNNGGQKIVIVGASATISKTDSVSRDTLIKQDATIIINLDPNATDTALSISESNFTAGQGRNGFPSGNANGFPSGNANENNFPSGTPGGGTRGQGRVAQNIKFGKVTASDATSVTIVDQSNNSVTIKTTDATKYTQTVTGSQADLLTGLHIRVQTPSTDAKSLTATSIVIGQ